MPVTPLMIDHACIRLCDSCGTGGESRAGNEHDPMYRLASSLLAASREDGKMMRLEMWSAVWRPLE